MLNNSTKQKELDMAFSCCKGEGSAQFALFELYKHKMYGLCRRYTNCTEDAEDLLQEGFIKVYEGICGFKGQGSLEGWIYKIFIRQAIHYIRKNYPSIETIDPDSLAETMKHEQDMSLEIEQEEEMIEFFQKLPPGYRTVLNLYVIEDKSHEEIAEELGIAVSTSRSQLTRAKALLKKLISKTLILI